MSNLPDKQRAKLLAIAESARDQLRAKHFRCSCGCADAQFRAAVSAWATYAEACGVPKAEAERNATEIMVSHAAAVERLAAERRGQTLH